MTDDVQHIMLDHLRAIRVDIEGLKEGQKEIKAEIFSIKKTILMVQSDALRREETIAGMQVDVDRIKRRLDLTDA